MRANPGHLPHRRLAATLAISAVLLPGLSTAQVGKPITIVISTGPGASNDLETRMYGSKLTELTGTQVIADYKPGAGTTIAAAYVARSVPDGYTLLGISSSFTAAAALYSSLPYDPIKDFSPVSLMSKRTTVLVVHPSAPFKTVQEYVSYTKAHPGEINVATVGAGSGPHINAVWLHMLANTKVTFVHYKSASGMQADLLGGRVHMTYGSLLTALPHLKSGKLRLLALGNAERSPLMPEARTVAEQGLPGYDYSSMYGLLAPGGTPQPIVSRLNAEFVKVAKSADIIKRLEAEGGLAVGSTSQAFGQLIATEIGRYRKIVSEAGIKPND